MRGKLWWFHQFWDVFNELWTYICCLHFSQSLKGSKVFFFFNFWVGRTQNSDYRMWLSGHSSFYWLNTGIAAYRFVISPKPGEGADSLRPFISSYRVCTVYIYIIHSYFVYCSIWFEIYLYHVTFCLAMGMIAADVYDMLVYLGRRFQNISQRKC